VSEDVKSGQYKMEVTAVGTKATTSGTAIGTGATPAKGKVTINGESVIIEAGTSLQSAFESIRDLGECVDVEVTTDTTLAAGSTLTFTSLYEGSSQKVEISCDNADLANFLGISSSTVTEYGTDAEVTLNEDDFDETTTTVSADGNQVTILGKDGFEVKMDVSAEAEVQLTVLDAGPITLQIGANEGQTIVVGIPRVDTETLEIADLNVRNTDGASAAIDSLDFAINKVSTVRAKLGAYENRLDHCINNLDTSNENITEALSRISDLDMAEEMTNYTQLSILQQAGTSMLSQANQMPQTILSMLQG